MSDQNIVDAAVSTAEKIVEFGETVADKIKTKIPGSFSVPYRTNDVLNGKPVWAVRLNVGALPNATAKLVAIPAAIMNVWGPISERWLDLNNSYAYLTSANQSIPIPWVSGYTRNTALFSDGFTESIIVVLNSNAVSVTTESNRTNLTGVVTVKYTRADGT